METGDPKRDIAALFTLVERMQGRMDEVFRRLYSDPTLPYSHGDIPAIIKQQQEITTRCVEHARCLAEDRTAIRDLRLERKRWLRNARWVLGIALTSGLVSAIWTAVSDFLVGK